MTLQETLRTLETALEAHRKEPGFIPDGPMERSLACQIDEIKAIIKEKQSHV